MIQTPMNRVTLLLYSPLSAGDYMPSLINAVLWTRYSVLSASLYIQRHCKYSVSVYRAPLVIIYNIYSQYTLSVAVYIALYIERPLRGSICSTQYFAYKRSREIGGMGEREGGVSLDRAARLVAGESPR